MQTIPISFLLSDAAPAGGTAASSAVGVAIVGLVFLACLVLAVRAGLRHLRGEGGCCGGCAAPPPASASKAIGPEVARRTLELSGWKMHPDLGALAMSLSSFCVVSNALRLNRFDPLS